MTIIVAVVVAFLTSGTYNYAAAEVDTLDDCKAKVAEIAHARLEANKTEEDKVFAFSFKCVEFEMPPKPKHVPGKNEA
jgi:hypothetical protein